MKATHRQDRRGVKEEIGLENEQASWQDVHAGTEKRDEDGEEAEHIGGK